MAGLSFGAVVQYAVIGILGYVLAGAPLLSLLSSPASSRAPSPNENFSLDKIESLVIPDPSLQCGKHNYQVHILNRDPLVVYIEGFVSAEEAQHIVKISEPKFTPSTVWTEGKESLNDAVRKSEKAQLDRDQVVQCVEDRARKFQGWRPFVYIEKLWSQRYRKNGHYTYHYDWATSTPTSGRISSFMVYLEANCTGGGTHFPYLKMPEDKSWCRFLECGEDGDRDGDVEQQQMEGVTFKAIAGNAVYWENLRSDGSGYTESWHAGLPVKEGIKTGLNIWSFYQEGLDVEKLRAVGTLEK